MSRITSPVRVSPCRRALTSGCGKRGGAWLRELRSATMALLLFSLAMSVIG